MGVCLAASNSLKLPQNAPYALQGNTVVVFPVGREENLHHVAKFVNKSMDATYVVPSQLLLLSRSWSPRGYQSCSPQSPRPTFIYGIISWACNIQTTVAFHRRASHCGEHSSQKFAKET